MREVAESTTSDLRSNLDPAFGEVQELDRVAEAALYAATVLLEAGVRAKLVHEDCSRIARALGAEHVELGSGYASFEITIARGTSRITRMVEVGALGVNYQLSHAMRELAQRIGRGRNISAEALSEMTRIKRETGRHAPWVVALATGIACAAFGRLLGMDWSAFIPVLASGAIGQSVRHSLLRRGANVFVVAACVAFLASGLAELGAQWADSTTLHVAMIASVLLLVPGVPVLNAHYDILDGYPTLGTARAVFVGMILIFMTTGVLIAQMLVGLQQ